MDVLRNDDAMEEGAAAGEDDMDLQDEDAEPGAPRYVIPNRTLTAVEMPAIVQNIDRAVKTFGRVPSLQHALDPIRNSIPLYLNPESPFCKPVMSHNARTHNVVLKVTVPKRTGRKRKRGSDEPWQGDIEIGDATEEPSNVDKVCSVARLDDPRVLKRKLEDNVDRYQVEAVGIIKRTHRFRGLADFYWDMTTSPFAQRYVEQVLPGNVEQLRQFQFMPGTDRSPNVDVLPPPIFTHMNLPFNYNYSQNPYVRATDDGSTVNLTAVKQIGHFIGAEDPTPSGPQHPPDMTDIRTVEVMAQLEEAFEERPIWTRRSLLNHLGEKLHSWNELKKFLNYAAYQFKGGPWRDAVIAYGVDPRSDHKFRVYQTLMFRLPKQKRPEDGQSWRSVRKVQMGPQKEYSEDLSRSHIFDGEHYHMDGKVWQVCDITDPLLKELLDQAAVRPSWDVGSGFYHGGLWAKVKAIMKTKLVAMQFSRRLTKRDFEATLRVRDETPVRSATATFHLPLPNLNLNEEELTVLKGRRPTKRTNKKQYSVRVRDPAKTPTRKPGSSSTAAAQEAAGVVEEDNDGEDGEDEDDGEDYDSEAEESESGNEGDEDGDGEENEYNEAEDDIEMYIDPALQPAE